MCLYRRSPDRRRKSGAPEFCSLRRRPCRNLLPLLFSPRQVRAPCAPPKIINETLRGVRDRWSRRVSRGARTAVRGREGAYVSPQARGRFTGCSVRTGPFLVRALNALLISPAAPRLLLDPLLCFGCCLPTWSGKSGGSWYFDLVFRVLYPHIPWEVSFSVSPIFAVAILFYFWLRVFFQNSFD